MNKEATVNVTMGKNPGKTSQDKTRLEKTVYLQCRTKEQLKDKSYKHNDIYCSDRFKKTTGKRNRVKIM